MRIKNIWNNAEFDEKTLFRLGSTMKTKKEKLIRIKKCSNPIQKVKQIYEALSYDEKPFFMKKSVVP